jgi:branched-chain amino acid transport system permease protein
MRDALPRIAVRVLALGAGAAVLFWLPTYVSDFRQEQFALVGMWFIAILGQNIVTGYAGQISLGHGAFMMIGAYTTAILVGHYGWTHGYKLATIPVAGVIAFGAGAVVGLPALRLTGLYVALVTFALAVALPQFVTKWPHFTGGTSGLPLSYSDIPGNHYLYVVSWSCAAILFVLAWLLLRGRIGRAFRAIRDSEIAAVSSGVSLPVYKTLAFAISAAFAGVAGAVYAIITNIESPQNFPLSVSINLIVGAAVAGFGSLWGIWVGAILLEFLPIWAQNAPVLGQNAPAVMQGLILILVMFVLPGGFAGLLRQLAALPARARSFGGTRLARVPWGGS